MFSAEGDATRLRYVAMMKLRGVLELGEPRFGPIFDMIGTDATRGIPAAVEAALPPARAAAGADFLDSLGADRSPDPGVAIARS